MLGEVDEAVRNVLAEEVEIFVQAEGGDLRPVACNGGPEGAEEGDEEGGGEGEEKAAKG